MCESVCRKCFEETLVALGDHILPLDVFEIILDSQMLIFNQIPFFMCVLALTFMCLISVVL